MQGKYVFSMGRFIRDLFLSHSPSKAINMYCFLNESIHSDGENNAGFKDKNVYYVFWDYITNTLKRDCYQAQEKFKAKAESIWDTSEYKKKQNRF